MRILFVHEVNYLKKPIFEMHEFPEHLAALGHDVGFVQFPEGESGSSLAEIPLRQLIQGRVLPEQQLTLYTPQTPSGGLLGRLITAFTFKTQFKKILRDFEPDVVVSFSVPTSGWQAMQACKKLGIPLMFRALDVSHKIRKSFFSPLVGLAERFVYRHADWVSANNPAMLEYCKAMGASNSSSSVELPPLDISHFTNNQIDQAVMRNRFEIPGTANVCLYMGSFFYFSGLPELLTSFSTLRQENEYLVLVGGGEQEAELQSLTRNLGIGEFVKFTGFVSFDNLPGYLKLASVAVNPMHPSTVSNAAFPNKVIQYMAAGLPVVSTRLQGLVETFGDSAGLVYAESSSEVYRAVQALYASAKIASVGSKNLSSVKERFSISSAVMDMELRLKELIEVSQ